MLVAEVEKERGARADFAEKDAALREALASKEEGEEVLRRLEERAEKLKVRLSK